MPESDAARYARWLQIAVEEAEAGLASGGIPIGAALIDRDGRVLGRGHNRRVQDDDPSVHGETAAFKAAGRQRSYAGTTMVTTLSPCWYCSGLVRQFGISRVVIGEARTFSGGHEWLAENGVEVVVLDDPGCERLMTGFIAAHPALWYEDIGEDDTE
ncbi:cytosine deaminase [Spinactinospora alkalitolerans]|uniref:Cytosine deaminase n=1 Tax=Spinactinospora alkalitolerans TaxID=687207 RepID=A0A852TP10_9ACTN|nr:nucleoside deaminase [Spinactinospora alkalitolerans]NYE45719.1 cytosine deaminase [Spinactinospora alkalitolerans]